MFCATKRVCVCAQSSERHAEKISLRRATHKLLILLLLDLKGTLIEIQITARVVDQSFAMTRWVMKKNLDGVHEGMDARRKGCQSLESSSSM